MIAICYWAITSQEMNPAELCEINCRVDLLAQHFAENERLSTCR